MINAALYSSALASSALDGCFCEIDEAASRLDGRAVMLDGGSSTLDGPPCALHGGDFGVFA